MSSRENPAGKTAPAADTIGNTDGTIRVEHDRKRLLLAATMSGVATLALPGVLIANSLRLPHPPPAWTLVPVCVAVLVAALGFVRSIIRLQDGDPALVISPRGLKFRPYLFGEIVRIPWDAIRGFKSRSYKQQRVIVVQVDDVDRYAPRVGFLGFLRSMGRRKLAANQISFSTPMARSAWKDVEATLQRYLARYGPPRATKDAANQGGPNAGAPGRSAKFLH